MTRIQVTTVYANRKIRATVNTGEHARKYVTLPYAFDDNYAERHRAAAQALADRFGLTGEITYAGTENRGGTVFWIAP